MSDGVEFRHDDKPKGCFHFYVSRNMSSLLSEATKMLQQVRDRHEREWILTFIYRIKALAEHLRTHPESRNYQCLPGEDEEGRRRNSIQTDHSKNSQQELYFVDDNWPNSLQKRSKANSDQSEEVNPKTTDNQNSPPLSTGAQQEEQKPEEESKSSKEQDSKAASEELSSAESEPKAKDAPGKPEDSI
ncbi:hypothetical protein CEXT_331041 [Caerostris extrusa]|uniref:Uncharacterized protein n=1 Tax=Caerostris extrusa TaxID=172846 RepID=A0AAV4V9F5_CAEEX|nr:hypothetical protein CEXT_331041 [Caerostris extrusa]